MSRPWKPSARASELIAALWDAFEQGDKVVRITHGSTARMTGQSLVNNGIASWADDDASWNEHRRIRLSNVTLAANGYPTRDWQQYRDDMAELAELDRLDGLAS